MWGVRSSLDALAAHTHRELIFAASTLHIPAEAAGIVILVTVCTVFVSSVFGQYI